MITLFLTPFNLAFADELDPILGYTVFTLTIDFFFLIDLIMCFFTAYVDDKNQTVDDRCEIAKEYLSGWFLIDLISIIPFEFMMA